MTILWSFHWIHYSLITYPASYHLCKLGGKRWESRMSVNRQAFRALLNRCFLRRVSRGHTIWNNGIEGKKGWEKKKDQVKNAGWICMHQREAVHFVMAEAGILNSRETGTSRTGIRTGGCREVIFKLGVKGGGTQIGCEFLEYQRVWGGTVLPGVEEKSYRYSKHLEQTARARISDGCAGGKRDRCIWSDNELARLCKSMSPRLRTSDFVPGHRWILLNRNVVASSQAGFQDDCGCGGGNQVVLCPGQRGHPGTCRGRCQGRASSPPTPTPTPAPGRSRSDALGTRLLCLDAPASGCDERAPTHPGASPPLWQRGKRLAPRSGARGSLCACAASRPSSARKRTRWSSGLLAAARRLLLS